MITEDNHTKEFEEAMRRPPNYITRNGYWLLLLLLLALGILVVKFGDLLF